jgi:hypothetical protein
MLVFAVTALRTRLPCQFGRTHWNISIDLIAIRHGLEATSDSGFEVRVKTIGVEVFQDAFVGAKSKMRLLSRLRDLYRCVRGLSSAAVGQSDGTSLGETSTALVNVTSAPAEICSGTGDIDFVACGSESLASK